MGSEGRECGNIYLHKTVGLTQILCVCQQGDTSEPLFQSRSQIWIHSHYTTQSKRLLPTPTQYKIYHHGTPNQPMR